MAAVARRRFAVPAVGHADDYWVAMTDDGEPRAAMVAASGPYETTVPARLADLVVDLPADLAADAQDAATELARFDGHARSRLGGDSPALAPVRAALLRAEAAASSRIADLAADARQLALAELGQATAYGVAILADVRTTEAALRLDHLDEEAVLTLHRELVVGARLGPPEHAGRYRDRLAWVGSSTVTPRGAAYVAPKSPLVPAAMRDLVAFVRREDLDGVVQAAIAHAQLATIHPFAEGDGRTGRALVQAMLRTRGLTSSTTAPVSAGLLVGSTTYAAALDAFRAGDARPVVERFGEACRVAARAGTDLVDRLAEQLDEGDQALAGAQVRPRAEARRVLPHLVAQPVVDGRHLEDRFALSAPTAQHALAQLVDAGLLTERTGLKRNRVWQHDGILAVLDGFAAGLARG